MSVRQEPTLAGDGKDKCPLCGILRMNAGYLKATCGQGYTKPGCFVQPTTDRGSDPRAQEAA